MSRMRKYMRGSRRPARRRGQRVRSRRTAWSALLATRNTPFAGLTCDCGNDPPRASGASRPCFWPDEVSIAEAALIDAARILTPGQVTEAYLLALAQARGGKLATLDRKLSAASVPRGKSALQVIGSR